MMARTQITLDTEQHHAARQKASQLGISLAEYVRRLVSKDLQTARPKPDVSLIFDLGSSGGSDIARDKDEMVAEAVEANFRRKMGR